VDTGLVPNACRRINGWPGPKATPKISEPEFKELRNLWNSVHSKIHKIPVQKIDKYK